MSMNSFRKKLFGGLNSEDVEEYIQNLEHEIESVKVLHQKEKNELLKKIEDYEEAPVEDLNSPLQQQVDELMKKLEEKEQENGKLKTACDVLEKEKIREKKLREQILISENSAKDQWEKRIFDLKQENETLKKKIQDQIDEIKEQQEKLVNQEEDDENKEDSFFDYSVVSKIMDDANRNAEMIIDEAKQKAEEILKEADKEAERSRNEIASKINAQLEEKGIQLMAAKYKIEQYVKSINSLQQEMYGLYDRMNKLVETMPVRIDNYWDGEHYKMIENRWALAQKKEKEQNNKTENPGNS